MRVVTWNIELGCNIERAADEIDQSENLRNPDVLLVQEMDPEGVRRLSERLGMGYRFAAPAHHRKTGLLFGNAVLSKWSMSDVVETPMPHTAVVRGQQRAATSAVVDVGTTQVEAHSVHVETVMLDIRRRVAQVRSVADATREGVRPCIVGGDFNTASMRSLLRFDEPLETIGFERITAQSTKTLRRFGRAFALDHLYVRALRPLSVGVEATSTASDHFPVWAELEAEV